MEPDANRTRPKAYLAPGASDWAPLNDEAFISLKYVSPPVPAKIVANRTEMSDILATAPQIPNLDFFGGKRDIVGCTRWVSVRRTHLE